ncbi:DUF6301 family protein [Streptomyces sp. NPDC053048]|uniref:DUF6301 family protein n=1 Tax=Streptomyces sp. NPDC053048 TaxID=3365694 RepID=UPI0037D4FE8E
MNNGATAITHSTDPASAARLVRTLHDVSWGDWSRAEIDAIVAAQPGWRVHREFTDGVVIGTDPARGSAGPELYFRARTNKGSHYRMVSVGLLTYNSAPVAERRKALHELVDALAAVGEPTRHQVMSDGPGLRWRNADRTMILQGSEQRVWLAIHPVRERFPAVGEVAHVLHDLDSAAWAQADIRRIVAARPGWDVRFDDAAGCARVTTDDPDVPELTFLGFDASRDAAGLPRYDYVGLTEVRPGSGLRERRELAAGLLGALVDSIGQPTSYGGSGAGPDVRWRSANRVLRLLGDGRRFCLRADPAEELEADEMATFEHGGPSGGPDGPSDFPRLPYAWQLHRYGPGEEPVYLPGGRLALTMEHLREALELLLPAWAEQIPAQLGEDRMSVTLVNHRDRKRTMAISYDVKNGIDIRVGGRSGDDAEAADAAMLAAGWQRHGKRWKAVFKDPDDASAVAAARLLVAELRVRGVTDPMRDLSVKSYGCGSVTYGTQGFLRLTGLGIGR